MNDLEYAKQVLQEEKLTMAVVKEGNIVYRSDRRGIKPVMSAALEGGAGFAGASAADTVVGKAAAMLYASLGIASLYAGLVSKDAKKILNQNDIYLEYDNCTEYILNKDKTDKCPIEKIALSTEKVDELTNKIQEFFEKIKMNH